MGIVLAVLLADQLLKFYIKTSFSYGTGFNILGADWARIHFVENEGMAFGLTFGNKCLGVRQEGQCVGINITPESGKLILSCFRILMVGFLYYLIIQLYKAKESFGLLISFSLILAGAMGNILDSAFYGLIFSSSPYHGSVAQLFPEGGGYAPFLYGKVVDMFYFPMVDTILPEWIPLIGGQRFEFFKPVFNLADASITTGVCMILLFHRNFLKKGNENQKTTPEQGISEEGQDLNSY
jgi:signal peptidase II